MDGWMDGWMDIVKTVRAECVCIFCKCVFMPTAPVNKGVRLKMYITPSSADLVCVCVCVFCVNVCVQMCLHLVCLALCDGLA